MPQEWMEKQQKKSRPTGSLIGALLHYFKRTHTRQAFCQSEGPSFQCVCAAAYTVHTSKRKLHTRIPLIALNWATVTFLLCSWDVDVFMCRGHLAKWKNGSLPWRGRGWGMMEAGPCSLTWGSLYAFFFQSLSLALLRIAWRCRWEGLRVYFYNHWSSWCFFSRRVFCRLNGEGCAVCSVPDTFTVSVTDSALIESNFLYW